jgi:pyridoxal phosphate enzyme (YggS family)
VKTIPAETVAQGIAAGLTDLGENYVQEARTKRAALDRPAIWHLIGSLQRNKVRAAVEVFDRIHTVDAEPLAVALAAEATRAGRRLPVLVQVNVSGEAARRGADPDAVAELGAAILRLPALSWDGFMGLPPPEALGEAARPYFRQLREVRDRTARGLGLELPHLSMGMSADFTIAVEEGATLLRLGRVLFGARGLGARRPGSAAGGEGS